MKSIDYEVTLKDFFNTPQAIIFTNRFKKALTKGMTGTELKIVKKELLTNVEFIKLLCLVFV